MSNKQVPKADPQPTYCLCNCGRVCWSHYYKVSHGPAVMQRVLNQWYAGDWKQFVERHGGNTNKGYGQVLTVACDEYGSIAQCALTYLSLEKAPGNDL